MVGHQPQRSHGLPRSRGRRLFFSFGLGLLGFIGFIGFIGLLGLIGLRV